MCRPHAEPSKQTQSKENSQGHPYISSSAATGATGKDNEGCSIKEGSTKRRYKEENVEHQPYVKENIEGVLFANSVLFC